MGNSYLAPLGRMIPVQTVWRMFCQGVVRVFYRRCEVDGVENIPAQGAVLLCANHPSALIDAVIVQSVCPRLAHPLARAGLFRHPLLWPILALIQAVPVYRRKDADGDPSRNLDAFESCYRFFASGETLLIFPEGESHSHHQLLELKTGAARMVLGALERNGQAPVTLPIGLNFSQVGRFRGSVLVTIGKPVPVERRRGEADEEAVLRLTGALGEALRGVTLNAEHWDDLSMARRLERFFSLRRGKYRRRNLSQRFRVLRRLMSAQSYLREKQPGRLAQAAARLAQFEQLCRSLGVRDYHLTVSYTPGLVARFILRGLTIVAVGLPVGAWGFLNSALPYALTGLLSLRMASDRYQYETAKVLFGMGFFSLCWSAQTALVYMAWGAWPAVAYGLSLLPSAVLALYLRRERERIWGNVRVFFLFIRKRELRVLLELQREELEKELAGLARLIIWNDGFSAKGAPAAAPVPAPATATAPPERPEA